MNTVTSYWGPQTGAWNPRHGAEPGPGNALLKKTALRVVPTVIQDPCVGATKATVLEPQTLNPKPYKL